MNIKKTYVGLKKNIFNRGFISHYNIRADPMFSIGYVAVRQITCSCCACLRQMDSPCNTKQDNYNQY